MLIDLVKQFMTEISERISYILLIDQNKIYIHKLYFIYFIFIRITSKELFDALGDKHVTNIINLNNLDNIC